MAEAILFPGQGSQFAGMGRDWAEAFPTAARVFEQADEILAFRERVGPFGTLLYTGHDWVDPTLARTSMELMRSEVWPRVLDGLP